MSASDGRSEEIVLSKHYSLLTQIVLLIRFTFRGYFGLHAYNKRGHFIDNEMSRIMYEYSDWTDYSRDTRLKGHGKWVYNSVVSSDHYGRYLFSCDANGKIIVWDLTMGTINPNIHEWQAHDRWLHCLAYHPPDLLASAGNDDIIKVWRLENKEMDKDSRLNGGLFRSHRLLLELKGHTDSVKSVQFIHPPGYYYARDHHTSHTDVSIKQYELFLISSSDDRSIRLWNVNQGTCVLKMIGHFGYVSKSLMVFPMVYNDELSTSDARFKERFANIVSVSYDETVRVWTIDRRINEEDSADDDDDDPTDSLFSYECVNTFKDKTHIDDRIDDLSMSCDHSRIAISARLKVVILKWPELEYDCRMWDRMSGMRARTVCFHPKIPHVLAIGFSDKMVQLMDVRSGEKIRKFDDHIERVHCVCFTPDGTRLISGGDDRMVWVRDVSFLFK